MLQNPEEYLESSCQPPRASQLEERPRARGTGTDFLYLWSSWSSTTWIKDEQWKVRGFFSWLTWIKYKVESFHEDFWGHAMLHLNPWEIDVWIRAQWFASVESWALAAWTNFLARNRPQGYFVKTLEVEEIRTSFWCDSGQKYSSPKIDCKQKYSFVDVMISSPLRCDACLCASFSTSLGGGWNQW